MQNQIETDDGKTITIYHEGTDISGYVIRELLKTKNAKMTFQAGYYARRPMRLPIYTGSVATSHRDGDDVQVFHLHGYGKTKAEAITSASNKLLRGDMVAHQARFAR